MRMTGEQRIAAPRARVWEALNDPEVLRQSIPGCQSLEKEADDRLRATVEVKIGPIGARFNGVVTLSDVDPPNGYTITGEGQGGTVGSAKGGAMVRLVDDSAGTLLTYEVDAQVGGRLAQLGGPIIDATAKRLAGQFFTRFGQIVAGAAPVPTAASGAVAPVASVSAPLVTASSFPIAWVLAVIVAMLAGYLVGLEREWVMPAIGLLVIVVAVAAFLAGRSANGDGR